MSESEPTTGPESSGSVSTRWLILPLLVLLGAVAFVRLNQTTGSSNVAVGKPAPEIDLVRLESNPSLERIQMLGSGDITLVHFWGTWCGPCKMEYPELDAMVQGLQNPTGFQFLSISCEGSRGETYEGLTEKTLTYLNAEGLDPTVYADPMGVTRRSAAQRMEISNLYYPTSILVGADGNIVDVWMGYTPESVHEMESQIQRLLAAR